MTDDIASTMIASILVEANVTLEHRAKMHAALGEPVRLALAERLVLTDRSPGELAQDVDLTSNLLAHHLQVLEDAGLIRRRRSEGDHRRSYVQLCLDNPEVVALLSLEVSVLPMTGSRVVFVCTQNSARSQLAAAVWNDVSRTPALSAGTHPAARVHPRAVTTARRHGFRLGQARTARVEDVLGPDDLVVAVCDNAYEELSSGDAIHPGLHWAVPDPVRADTDVAFEIAYDEIQQRVGRLAAALDAGDR